MLSDHTPFLIVVSAPSGCGKTTILRRVLALEGKLSFSVSVTSREPRPGEKEGKDYFFISESEFKSRIAGGEFLEYALVHGNCYGTARAQVMKLLQSGQDVVLDVDVQGVAQLAKTWPFDMATIFIVPPSFDELRHRLVSRGTDDGEVISRRLANARGELRFASQYRYLLVNDEIDKAVAGFRQIISAERAKVERNRALLESLSLDFEKES